MIETDTREARAEAVRALEGEFGQLFNQFRRLIMEQAERVCPGMQPGAYKVFSTVARSEAVTLSVLADMMMMDKGQLSRTIRELEQLGLVARTPDPHDGRSFLLSLTPVGLERMEAGRRDRGNPLVEALQEWPVDDIRTLTRLMHALVNSETPVPVSPPVAPA